MVPTQKRYIVPGCLWCNTRRYNGNMYNSILCNECRGGGGGGGGALGYLGGCIRSLSKLKNTPKALISAQKSTLILR